MARMNLGSRIAAWRMARGMTQRELAKRVGVTVPAVYHWENGEAVPRVKNVEKIASVCGVSVRRFYGEVPKPRARA